MKKATKLLLKTYRSNPATIAFLDGIFISAAINILTGMGTYEGDVKWIALAASVTMLVGSIILLLWQNSASKLQEYYKSWVEDIKIRNDTVDKNDPKPYDWIAFISKCDENHKNTSSELPHYSIRRLVCFSIFCCICLLISVGLMVWSFI